MTRAFGDATRCGWGKHWGFPLGIRGPITDIITEMNGVGELDEQEIRLSIEITDQLAEQDRVVTRWQAHAPFAAFPARASDRFTSRLASSRCAHSASC